MLRATISLAAVLGILAAPAVGSTPTVGGPAKVMSRWAVVAGPGYLLHWSSSVVSGERLDAGEYAVVFDQKVGGCAFNASPQRFIGYVFVATSKLPGNSAGVLVHVWDDHGSPFDDAFHLQLTCGRRALFAVVDASGTLKRGRHVISTQALGSGRYQVAFDRDVSACALKATIGSVDARFPTAGYIVAARRIDPTVVVVQTFDLAGAGENRAFHLAVDCSSPDEAMVNADGTLAGGHAYDSHWLPAGNYAVTFFRDVSACSWVATIAEGVSRGVPAPDTIGVFALPDEPSLTVGLESGDRAQQPFDLVVNC